MTAPDPVPHSLRTPRGTLGERRPSETDRRRQAWPPPGWTAWGLLEHQRKHKATMGVLHLLADGAATARDALVSREMEVEHRATELTVRDRELAQFGRTLADRAQAMQEATEALLALPWIGAVDTESIPAQRDAS